MKVADEKITIYLVLILILLIVGIFIYSISKTITKEKGKEIFETEISNIITTAKEYYNNNTNFSSEYVVFTIENGKIVEDGLNYDGSLPNSGTILINNIGEVQIVAEDNTWCATKRYSDTIINVEEYFNNCEVIESIKLGNINVTLSVSEDGLYQEEKEYYYRGQNPNNYLEISDMLYRIISIDENKNIKVILNENLYNSTWNSESLTDNSYDVLDINNIAYNLNYLETSNSNFNLIRKNTDMLEYNWNNVQISNSNNKLYSELKQEKTEKNVFSIVGLLSVTDYVRASFNDNCYLDSFYNNECGDKNYLNVSQNFFTINSSKDYIWAVSSDGKLYETSLDIKLGVRPVIVLSGNIELIGKGTIDVPYRIK